MYDGIVPDSDCLIAFTDGSAFVDALGGGGSGVVFARFDRHVLVPQVVLAVPTGLMVTNYGSELRGIDLALAHVQNMNDPPKCVVVLSDSQQAVRAARSDDSGQNDNYWTLLQTISTRKKQLRQFGVRVMIDWIPGHAGIFLNDLADQKAKSAAQVSRTTLNSDPSTNKPVLVAKSFIKRRLGETWQGWWWNSTDRGRNLFQVKQSVLVKTPKVLFEGLSRRSQVCITRLRLGNETTNEVLFKVGKTSSPIVIDVLALLIPVNIEFLIVPV